MSDSIVFVYGCYGYTGVLICEEAKKRGVNIIVGGRNKQKCVEIAKRFKIDPDSPDNPSIDKCVRVFDLSDEKAVAEQLASLPDNCNTVMNVAGPYSKTFDPMVKGCLANKLSYLDVTGEIDVFESAQGDYNAPAKDKGVIVLPGCGMDVVPTDCLAAHLQRRLPTADTLKLAFGAIPKEGHKIEGPGFSRGTAMTAVEHLGKATRGRVNGRIQDIKYSYIEAPLHKDNPRVGCTAISWGDVSTAYHSTKIPNITTYMMSEGNAGWTFYLGSLWPIRMLTRYLIPDFVKQKFVPAWGPSDADRTNTQGVFWGRADDSRTGKHVMSRLTSYSGYVITAMASVEIMKRVSTMSRDELQKKAGAHTPSSLFGADFITEVDANATFDDQVSS